MNDINYVGLVTDTLMRSWGDRSSKMNITAPDLTAGIALFTKVALDAVNNPAYRASSDTSSTTVDKIKEFIDKNGSMFQVSCRYGYPFSHLTGPDTEQALKQYLQNGNDMLCASLLLNDWIDETDLEARFGGVVKHLDDYEMRNTCAGLSNASLHDGNNKAGYALLWLIKFSAGCDFEIPKELGNTSVSQVLSEFVLGSLKVADAPQFARLLMNKMDGVSLFLHLDPKALTAFVHFVTGLLVTIPIDRWPTKPSLIVMLIESIIKNIDRVALSRQMAFSPDAATAEIGKHLLAAFTAGTLREALPHFYVLQELLQLTDHSIRQIFRKAFVSFREDKLFCRHDPEFTRRLSFNVMNHVFVRGPLMIGMYKSEYACLPPHLLAFDMTSEKMAWGTPIQTPKRRLLSDPAPSLYVEMVDDTIFMQVKGEKSVSLIDPETGEVKSKLELPVETNHVHFGPQGFAYLFGGDKLYGGQIKDNRWTTTFIKDASWIHFEPFSTHCGFYDRINKILCLFGPTGDQIEIDHYISFHVFGDKLYTIERSTGHACSLNVRTLKLNNEVVSPVEMSIAITVQEAEIGHVSQNGIVVLFTRKMDNISAIFVDLKTQKVTYHDQHFEVRSPSTVNKRTGELWIRDGHTMTLWKISAAQSLNMGNLRSGYNSEMLHVDDADHLYFF